jgi:hypothetical protein
MINVYKTYHFRIWISYRAQFHSSLPVVIITYFSRQPIYTRITQLKKGYRVIFIQTFVMIKQNHAQY